MVIQRDFFVIHGDQHDFSVIRGDQLEFSVIVVVNVISLWFVAIHVIFLWIFSFCELLFLFKFFLIFKWCTPRVKIFFRAVGRQKWWMHVCTESLGYRKFGSHTTGKWSFILSMCCQKFAFAKNLPREINICFMLKSLEGGLCLKFYFLGGLRAYDGLEEL